MRRSSDRVFERRRRWPWALLGTFLFTRLVMAILAGEPAWYTGEGLAATPYVYQSRDWALQVVASGLAPYVGAPIEYPPGLLPFILTPAWLLHVARIPYLPSFVFLMVVVDALGLLGTWRLSTRWGSRMGPWLWVVLLPILGPMVLLRLDLIPAVATIWCLERAATPAVGQAGALLGLGVLAKLYPAFLFPAGIALIRPVGRFVAGAVVAFAVGLLPFALSFGPMIGAVAGFHLERGVQIESSWGGAFLVAKILGSRAEVGRAFGSWDIVEGAGSVPEILSTILSFGVVVALAWWASRLDRHRSVRSLAVIWFATMSCLLVTGSVLSPQYLIWLIALGAAAASAIAALSMRTVVALGVAALLTHVGFPFLFDGLVQAEPVSVLVLIARNLCLVVVAIFAVLDVARLDQDRVPLDRTGTRNGCRIADAGAAG